MGVLRTSCSPGCCAVHRLQHPQRQPQHPHTWLRAQHFARELLEAQPPAAEGTQQCCPPCGRLAVPGACCRCSRGAGSPAAFLRPHLRRRVCCAGTPAALCLLRRHACGWWTLHVYCLLLSVFACKVYAKAWQRGLGSCGGAMIGVGHCMQCLLLPRLACKVYAEAVGSCGGAMIGVGGHCMQCLLLSMFACKSVCKNLAEGGRVMPGVMLGSC